MHICDNICRILWLLVTYFRALWHICVKSCILEIEKKKQFVCILLKPVICVHVTTYHVIWLELRRLPQILVSGFWFKAVRLYGVFLISHNA